LGQRIVADLLQGLQLVITVATLVLINRHDSGLPQLRSPSNSCQKQVIYSADRQSPNGKNRRLYLRTLLTSIWPLCRNLSCSAARRRAQGMATPLASATTTRRSTTDPAGRVLTPSVLSALH
jgi:hypothetical protein